MNFNSHTDAMVQVASALVNVATPGRRRGQPYEVPGGGELVGALHSVLRTGDRRVPRPGRDRIPALLELGATLRPVFTLADEDKLDDVVALINRLLARFATTPYLDRHDDEPWHLHFHGDPRRDPSGWGGSCCVGLAAVLGSEYADRLGVCGAPRCDRVFVDVSRNGIRRFCSTACQNRVKSAAHRARAAT